VKEARLAFGLKASTTAPDRSGSIAPYRRHRFGSRVDFLGFVGFVLDRWS
jgi:hypothetical protein